MHMADALLSPAVGGTFWVVSGLALARSCRGAHRQDGGLGVPLTGVLGAFIFAVQMINFAIPGTGSSGHLVGGLLLAILLGPQAAFLTLASVLVVQSLFFADGGLLALGCNLFNMGFLPIFVAYPFIYLPLAGRARPGTGGVRRRTVATLTAAVAGMLLGALAVAVETRLSGISALPLRTFLLALLPIHLVIGLAEGAATAGILRFFRRARPELLQGAPGGRTPWRAVALVGALAMFTGGCLSWGASRYPDGLEWAVARVAGQAALAPAGAVHHRLETAQQATAILPDYGLPGRGKGQEPSRAVTSLSGLVGGALTLLLVASAALALKFRRRTA
jgi:cobalt/nickel transport system permease protein